MTAPVTPVASARKSTLQVAAQTAQAAKVPQAVAAVVAANLVGPAAALDPPKKWFKQLLPEVTYCLTQRRLR
jgi:hypothetical protein